MLPLHKKGDQLRPEIDFDPISGKLSISGKYTLLDDREFLGEVNDWLKRYQESPSEMTNLKIDLKYLNGRSIRTLIEILEHMKQMVDNGSQVNVDWHVPNDADDLKDLSEQLLSNMQLPHSVSLN